MLPSLTAHTYGGDDASALRRNARARDSRIDAGVISVDDEALTDWIVNDMSMGVHAESSDDG